MTDTRQLVRNCLKGDGAAQRQLYNNYAPVMLGICYRYTKSIADAEDVLQEGFIKIFKNLHQYKFEGELAAWIRRIMVNTAINYLKRNSNYKYDLLFDNDAIHPISDENPEVPLAVKELADLIRQLPTGYQTIFNLHAIEGFMHVEIARMLGINEGTSRSQYARARALLIGWLKKTGEKKVKQTYAQK